jgi:hypothetical protein
LEKKAAVVVVVAVVVAFVVVEKPKVDLPSLEETQERPYSA